MRKDNQILHGDRIRCEENNSPGRPRMPTRDLFAVAITFLFDELNGLKVIDHSVVGDKTRRALSRTHCRSAGILAALSG